MRHLDRLARRSTEQRHSIETIEDYFTFLGHQYPMGLAQTWTGTRDQEPPPGTFTAFADQLFKASPVVFTAELIRKAVFSQARFQWRRQSDRSLFGDQSLRILEEPWSGGTTAKLMTRMLLHADLAGNAYPYRPKSNRLTLLRPDWCSIVLGSEADPDDPAGAEDAEWVGIIYRRGGIGKPQMFMPGEVAHFAPMPDPVVHFRGMSWLTPVIREIQTDSQATEYKSQFFKNSATPNLALKFDPNYTLEQIKAFKELFESEHRGISKAFKTAYIAGGADPTIIGSNFDDLEFSKLQGKAETRTLMAAGVHAVIAGASEGLGGSALNSGNYNQVRRIFSDVHLQDLWNEASSSLQILLRRPDGGVELTVDQRYVPFLQDDQKDQAEVQAAQARAITTLVKDGFTPDSAVAAVVNNDMKLLEHDPRFISVQLQKIDKSADEGNDHD